MNDIVRSPEAGIWAQRHVVPGGAVLFDQRLFPELPMALFDPQSLRQAGMVQGEPEAGRGSALFISTEIGDVVLRHYRRGGLLAGLLRDRYPWMGSERTRSFREFRLLSQMHQAGLPVPRPAAARYLRRGLSYRADLLTVAVPRAQTLAQCLVGGQVGNDMIACVARTVARFHCAGIFHADLNAHNVLIDDQGQVWLLDFDRGRRRVLSRHWQLANVARLQRSLRKLAETPEQIESINGLLMRHWAAAMEQGVARDAAMGR